MFRTSGLLAVLSAFFLASLVTAAPSDLGGWNGLEKRNIVWQNCSIFEEITDDPNLFCATYNVPLDYQNPSAGLARLALAKYVGSAKKKIGTLFVNPGGPGASGIDFVFATGQELAAMFNGSYDIVSWDPRGVGDFTFPGAVRCFDNAVDEVSFFKNSIVDSINYTIANGFDQKDQDELFAGTDQDAALLTGFGKNCQQGSVGNFLQFLGTTSTVRDLVTLADCIVGPNSPIDYYGLSYGTIIGTTFLTLFPKRAGHIILDGVIDPKTWVNFQFANTTLTNADETFAEFGRACSSAGVKRCKLIEFICGGTKSTATGPEITKLLSDVHDIALELQRGGFTGLPLSPGQFTNVVYEALTVPSSWNEFANVEAFNDIVTIFQAAQANNVSIGNYKIPLTGFKVRATPAESAGVASNQAMAAVIGADNTADIAAGVTMRQVLSQVVSTVKNTSPTFGGLWSTGNNFGWPTRAVEPVPAPNFASVSSPVVVVGNSADPSTPFSGAQSAASQIGAQALLVEQQGVGHTSMAQTSSCTSGILASYLVSSTLPSAPTSGGPVQCPVDTSSTNPFSGAGTGSSLRKRRLERVLRRRIGPMAFMPRSMH